jgi:hypothetical protein
MGQSNIKCLCCKGKENDIQLDSNKQQNINGRSPNKIKNENSKDLKAYVNLKNIKLDLNSINSNEKLYDDENIISKGKGNRKKQVSFIS